MQVAVTPLVVEDSMKSVSPSTGSPGGLVRHACPGVDHQLAVEVRGHLQADLRRVAHQCLEHGPDLRTRGALAAEGLGRVGRACERRRGCRQRQAADDVAPGHVRAHRLNGRQQRLPLRRKVLIDRVHHEAHPEVVAHDHHELHGVLPPEVSDHLLPQLAAHPVLAIERSSKGDERGVLVGQARHRPVVLDDVDDRLLEPLPQARGFVGRPLVLLVDFPRDDEHRELKEPRAHGAVHARWNTQAALPGAVAREVRGSRPRLGRRPRGQQLFPFLIQILRRDPWQARQRDRVDVGRQRRLCLRDRRQGRQH